MRRNPSYHFITREAESDEGMPAKYRILFHCFNERGAYAQLQKLHEKITAWTAEHPERPNGVILVHGSLNDTPRKRLFEALDAPKKRKNVTMTINLAIGYALNAITEGEAWLADESKWPAKK